MSRACRAPHAQMLAHGVSTGGLFALVGMMSDRRHTRLISEYGGIKSVMPRLTAAFLIITLSSVGLPGMNGFIGEFLIMLGAFTWNPWYVVGAGLGVILSAVYMLWMVQRVFYGPVTNDHNAHLPDLSVREWAIIGPLAAMAIVMGVFPNVFLKPMEPAVDRIVQRVIAHQPASARANDGVLRQAGPDARVNDGVLRQVGPDARANGVPRQAETLTKAGDN
ncbi:MAG: proton-conducting transporter membrane subunit [Vicinamibacterales bacterium]